MSQYGTDTATPEAAPEAAEAAERLISPPAGDELVTLHVTQIQAYEHNPRRERNAAFLEMKASIRATRRLVNRLTVTRRPGQEHYIIAAGGNTRLAILQELWEETHDDAFGVQQVIVQPWVSEIHAFTAHMIENRKRSDMSFWDSAVGCVFLREQLEAEAGAQLSVRKLVQAFERVGYAVGRSMLHQYEFAVKYLEPIHPWLTSDITKQLQPKIGEWVRLAAVFDIEAGQLHDGVIQPALQSYAFELVGDEAAAQVFSVKTLVARLLSAVAARLSVPVDVVPVWLDIQRARPDVSRDELLTSRVASATASITARKPSVDGQAAGDADAQQPHVAQVHVDPSADELLDRALELARLLAASTEAVDMVVADASAPAGFYVDVGVQAGDCPDPYLRDAVWWTLAQLSGQLYPDVLNNLPEHSTWRRMMGSIMQVGVSQPEVDSLLYQTQGRFDFVTRQPLIFTDYLPLVLFHQVGLAPTFSSLTETIVKLQQAAPERFAFARSQYLFLVKED